MDTIGKRPDGWLISIFDQDGSEPGIPIRITCELGRAFAPNGSQKPNQAGQKTAVATRQIEASPPVPSLEPPAVSRIFSIEQARAALPLVESIVRDVMRMERRVRHLRFRLKFIRGGSEDLQVMFDKEIRGLEYDLQQAELDLEHNFRELEELGIEPEGPGIGLVDFPSHREGETIFLCWRYGEPTIEYWHTLTGGFPNRVPLGQTAGKESVEFAMS